MAQPQVMIPKSSREIVRDVQEIMDRHVSHDEKVGALLAYFAAGVRVGEAGRWLDVRPTNRATGGHATPAELADR